MLTRGSLYEHVFIQSKDALVRVFEALTRPKLNSEGLAGTIKRSDSEPVRREAIAYYNAPIAELLTGLWNLTAVAFISPTTPEAYYLLDPFPPSLGRLYWRAFRDYNKVFLSPQYYIPVERLFRPFEDHPALITISFPFFFYFSDQTEIRAPHTRIREWIVRHARHRTNLYMVGLDGGMLLTFTRAR